MEVCANTLRSARMLQRPFRRTSSANASTLSSGGCSPLALLTEHKFDILYLVLPVYPETGDLRFFAGDPADESAAHPQPECDVRIEVLGAAAQSQTRLVVLASCRALLLAAEVATVANMAASDAEITSQQAAERAKSFYGLLTPRHSVHKSFELTQPQIDVPIGAVRQRDVAFAVVAA